MENSVITLTFGDVGENHKGMQQIGNMVEKGEGFNLTDLKQIKKKFKTNNKANYNNLNNKRNKHNNKHNNSLKYNNRYKINLNNNQNKNQVFLKKFQIDIF